MVVFIAAACSNFAAATLLYVEPINTKKYIRPLHSTFLSLASNSTTGNSDDWICDAGYFKSTPTSITGTPTCRACTPIDSSTNTSAISGIGCMVGWQLNPCNPFSDAICVPCPEAPPIGHVYFQGGNCQQTMCAVGWALSGEICIPCPNGFYCSGMTSYNPNTNPYAIPCGENCTTNHQGAVSYLECVQSEGKDEIAFIVQSTFSLSISQHQQQQQSQPQALSIFISTTSSTITTNNKDINNIKTSTATLVGLDIPITCSSFNAFITSWVKYGTLQVCSLKFLSSTLGVLSCTISTAQCIASKYVSWLLSAAISNKDGTAAAFSSCILQPDNNSSQSTSTANSSDIIISLALGSPIIQQDSFFPQRQQGFIAVEKVSDAPVLHIEPRKWGQGHNQTLATLLVFSALMWCLILSVICTCAALYMTKFRQKSALNVFTRIFKLHAKKLKINANDNLTYTFVKNVNTNARSDLEKNHLF